MRQTAPAKPSIQSPKLVQPLLAMGAAAALAACSQTGAHNSAAHRQPASIASVQPAHATPAGARTVAPAPKPRTGTAARTPAPAKVASRPDARPVAAPDAKPATSASKEAASPATGDVSAKFAAASKDADTEMMKEGVRAAIESQHATHGIASYYKHGTLTASGEKFDTNEFTAAHRTLPFGTRLRVTNLATGRSVLVRVNDRGPFIDGRVVDLTYAAAESLGFTRHGLAPVKLDVLR